MNRTLLLAAGSLLLLGTGVYIGTTLNKSSDDKDQAGDASGPLSPVIETPTVTSEPTASEQWAIIASRSDELAKLKKAADSNLEEFKRSLIREFPSIPPAAFTGDSYEEITTNASNVITEEMKLGKSAQLMTAIQREITERISSFSGELDELHKKYQAELATQKKTLKSVFELKQQDQQTLAGPPISAAHFYQVTQKIPQKLITNKGNAGADFDRKMERKFQEHRQKIANSIPRLKLKPEQKPPRPGLAPAFEARNKTIRAENRRARTAHQAKLSKVDSQARKRAKAEMGTRPKGYSIASDKSTLSPAHTTQRDWEAYRVIVQQLLPPGWKASTVPRPSANNPTHRELLIKASN